MLYAFLRRHPAVSLVVFGLAFGCMLLSCLGVIGKSVREQPDQAWGLIPGAALGATAVVLAGRFLRKPARQRGWVYGGLFVVSVLIWFAQGIHADGLYIGDEPGSTPLQLAAFGYAAVFGGSLGVWLLTRRTRQLRTGVVDVRAEPSSAREHRADDRVRVLERWHYRGKPRRWWHRFGALSRIPMPYDPYLVARCTCGWQGPPRDLRDRSAKELAFSDAHEHGTRVDPEIVYPIDQEVSA